MAAVLRPPHETTINSWQTRWQGLAPAFSEVLASSFEPEQLEQPVPDRVVFDRTEWAFELERLYAALSS